MSNNELYVRVTSAFCQALSGDSISGKLSRLYAAIALVDANITKENAHEHITVLESAALDVHKFGCRFGGYNHLREVAANIAVNYQMVAIEAIEANPEGPLDSAKERKVQELFKQAEYYIATRNNYEFSLRDVPPLERLELLNYPAPALMCDLEKARSRLRNRDKNRQEFARNIDQADHVLRSADHEIFSCRLMFEFDRHDYQGESVPVHQVVLLRPDLTDKNPTLSAQAMLHGARLQLKELGEDGSHDFAVNRSRRALLVCRMAVAHARATLANAYVLYWEKAPTFRHYKVLGQQARSFGEAVQLNNWDYFLPPVQYRTHEPLLEASKVDAELLISYGDGALAYAMALDAQMKTVRSRDEMAKVESQEINRPFEPMHGHAALSPWQDGQQTKAQSEYRSWHHDFVADEARREAAAGRSPYKHQHVGRMVGYPTVRSGKKHKRSNRARG